MPGKSSKSQHLCFDFFFPLRLCCVEGGKERGGGGGDEVSPCICIIAVRGPLTLFLSIDQSAVLALPNI